MPTSSSAVMPMITSRVSSRHRRGRRRRLNTVTKERLPRNAAIPMTTIGYGDSTWPVKLMRPPIRSKPALLKAETA